MCKLNTVENGGLSTGMGNLLDGMTQHRMRRIWPMSPDMLTPGLLNPEGLEYGTGTASGNLTTGTRVIAIPTLLRHSVTMIGCAQSLRRQKKGHAIPAAQNAFGDWWRVRAQRESICIAATLFALDITHGYICTISVPASKVWKDLHLARAARSL